MKSKYNTELFPISTKDAKFTIRLLEGTKCFQASTANIYNVQEVLEWLVLQEQLTEIVSIKKFCNKKNPVMVVFDVDKNEELFYSYRGNMGIQMQLF